MIRQCKNCENAVHHNMSMCPRCGQKLEQWAWSLDTFIYDDRQYHGTEFPKYKVSFKFGRVVAVPTRHNRREPDTRKQKRRRVAKRKKGRYHKTGRYPRR